MSGISDVCSSSLVPRLLALLFFFLGAAIALGGARLFTLGGSGYYLLGGVAVAVAAILLWRGHRLAGWLYAAFLAVTLGWALWEAGIDGWALAPRLIGPALLGLAFALAPIRRLIGRSEEHTSELQSLMRLSYAVFCLKKKT